MRNSGNAIRLGFETETMGFQPLVDPSNTVVVASQAPLGASRTKMCRRSYRVITGLVAIDATRKKFRDPRRDVNIVFAEAILSSTHVVVPVAKIGKAGH